MRIDKGLSGDNPVILLCSSFRDLRHHHGLPGATNSGDHEDLVGRRDLAEVLGDLINLDQSGDESQGRLMFDTMKLMFGIK